MDDNDYFDFFGELAPEVWENRIDLDMHTMLLDTTLLKATLLNVYNPEMMRTILNAFREQSEKDDQMKTTGEIIRSVPEPRLIGDQS